MPITYKYFKCILLLVFLGLSGASAFGQENMPEWHPKTKKLERMLQSMRKLNAKIADDISILRQKDLSLSDSSQLTEMGEHQEDLPPLNSKIETLGLQSEVDKLSQQYEFAMGQKEAILLNKQLEELSTELRIFEANSKVFNQLATLSDLELPKSLIANKDEYQGLVGQYKERVKSLDKSLEDYVSNHKAVKALQEEYLKNKSIESMSLSSRNMPEQFQTSEMLKEILVERFGGSVDQIGQMISEKIVSATEEVNALKEKFSNVADSQSMEMKNGEPYQRTPFGEKLTYGGDFSFNQGSPASLDMAFNLGYSINKKWITGLGVSYRTNLGKAIDQIDFYNLGWGYRAFVDYSLFSNFFLEAAYEAYSGEVAGEESTSTTETGQVRTWRNTALFGLGTNQQLSDKLTARFTVLYNFTPKNSQFTSPIVVRFGLSFNRKNKN